MKKSQRISGLIFFFILTLLSAALAEERLVITSYYPSPYGSYNELQTNNFYANKVAIGDTDGDGALNPADLPARDGELWVMRRLAVGTSTVSAKLQIIGTGEPIMLMASGGGPRQSLNFNADFSGGWKYMKDGTAFHIFKDDAYLIIRSAIGGDAGQRINWNPALAVLPSGAVGIVTTNPTSGLQVDTSFGTHIATVNMNNYTAADNDHIIFCNAAGNRVRIRLPRAANMVGRQYIITKIDSSAHFCNIQPQGGETISGNNEGELRNQWDNVTLVSIGAPGWLTIGSPPPAPSPLLTYPDASHTELECRNAGGTVFNTGQYTLCRFDAAGCPGGWARADYWQRYSQIEWGHHTQGDFCNRYHDRGPTDFQNVSAEDNERGNFVREEFCDCVHRTEYWHEDAGRRGHNLYRVNTISNPPENRNQIGCK